MALTLSESPLDRQLSQISDGRSAIESATAPRQSGRDSASVRLSVPYWRQECSFKSDATRPTLRSHPCGPQANSVFETSAAREERLSLRTDPLVLGALEMWWATAQNSMRVAGFESKHLHHDQYMLMSYKLYKAMLDPWDKEEAVRCSEDDWVGDCVGGNSDLRSTTDS